MPLPRNLQRGEDVPHPRGRQRADTERRALPVRVPRVPPRPAAVHAAAPVAVSKRPLVSVHLYRPVEDAPRAQDVLGEAVQALDGRVRRLVLGVRDVVHVQGDERHGARQLRYPCHAPFEWPRCGRQFRVPRLQMCVIRNEVPFS